jgi:outer membrane protein, multidrug efflux system
VTSCKKYLYIFILVLAFSGCKVHNVHQCPTPCTDIPESFSESGDAVQCLPWWEEFDDENLNCIMDCALAHNLDVQQAWNRLLQAKAQVCIDNSARYPQIDALVNVRTSANQGSLRNFGGFAFDGADEFEDFGGIGGGGGFSQLFLSGQLEYEIDLWRKIDSRVRASCKEMQATREDLDATALTLSGTVTDLWFTILEQKALLKLLAEQIESNETQLELIELRFTVGQSSALDVYQQRLTLSQTKSEVPRVRSMLKTSLNRLQVLLGRPPSQAWVEEPEDFAAALPPFPTLGTPWDLMQNRPDLRAARDRLMAADYEVAVAIADRFPQLRLLSSGDLITTEFVQFFERQTLSIAGSLLAPLFDGKRRKCEVARRRAILWERMNAFGESFLTALREVEDAIAQEKEQLALLEDLGDQLEISENTLRESQMRYLQGLTSYLDVIAAITALQNAQRRIISEKKTLLTYRSNLYRALGGSFVLTSCGETP